MFVFIYNLSQYFLKNTQNKHFSTHLGSGRRKHWQNSNFVPRRSFEMPGKTPSLVSTSPNGITKRNDGSGNVLLGSRKKTNADVRSRKRPGSVHFSQRTLAAFAELRHSRSAFSLCKGSDTGA